MDRNLLGWGWGWRDLEKRRKSRNVIREEKRKARVRNRRHK